MKLTLRTQLFRKRGKKVREKKFNKKLGGKVDRRVKKIGTGEKLKCPETGEI